MLQLNYISDMGDTNYGELRFDKLFFLGTFFLAFALIFLIRSIVHIYLFSQWRRQDIDPTYTETRISFRLFYTLGVFELILTIIGIVIYF